jgi:hypothetical protein
MTIAFDPNILLAYYQSRSGAPAAIATSNVPTKPTTPTAPWSVTNTAALAASTSKDVKDVLIGQKYIDENAAQLDVPGASQDYRKLFALYQGLSTLSGVVDGMNAKTATTADKTRIQAAFAKGLTEIAGYTDGLDLDSLRLTRGDTMVSDQSKVGVPKTKPEYVTSPLVSGSASTEVDAFQGDVKFNISIKRVGVTHDIPIDLSGMSQPRTLGNVVSYINDQLSAQGVATRVATQRIPGGPKTVQVAGKPVTVGTNPDQWAMKVKVDSGETVTFSAPTTAPSVYVAQSVGDPDPDGKVATDDGVTQRQLLKFQTDTTNLATPPQAAGEANWVDGRVWAENLDADVKTVRSTVTGSDGSVYMLADVDGQVNGQGIKGDQDVALLKYDSAGNLVYTRTLGASKNASGLALAVSADGQIAVAGSVTGGLNGATNGALNSGETGSTATNSDSFVTVYNADGEEQWTQRRGARSNDEATSVAFAADGTVYVAGRAQSTMPGTSAIGGWDSYVEGFKADAKNKVTTLFTQSFGTGGNDRPAGMVVDGNSLVVAGNENGHAVVRRFDVGGGTLVEGAVRDLGDLEGGDVTGIGLDGGQVVVAGTSFNGTLDSGTITRALAGGSDAFAARISSNLTAGAGDRLAYYGGSGNDKATALAVANGQVWLAGSAGTDLPGQDPVGKKDGFLTSLNMNTGDVDWSRRFTGKDGYAAPSSIAIDTKGSSVLDRLGLPTGTLDMTDSPQLAAVSDIRAGDTFQIRAGENGALKTITMDANETLDTLKTKVTRALGYQAKVDLVTVDGAKRLQIKPADQRNTIELFAGKPGKDALSGLGLTEGVVRTTIVDKNGKSVPADGNGQIYGLGLTTDLNLSNPDQINHALAQIAQAMGVIRSAYQDLVAAANPQAAAAKAAPTGPVPAYLTNQIANYQAALDRLSGGSPDPMASLF